jgi:hypothetical protein
MKKLKVSFEIIYPVIFYGNQVISTVKIRTTKSARSKRKQQAIKTSPKKAACLQLDKISIGKEVTRYSHAMT